MIITLITILCSSSATQNNDISSFVSIRSILSALSVNKITVEKRDWSHILDEFKNKFLCIIKSPSPVTALVQIAAMKSAKTLIVLYEKLATSNNFEYELSLFVHPLFFNVSSILVLEAHDVQQQALLFIKQICKHKWDLLKSNVNSLVPSIMKCIKSKVLPVKLSAERALVSLLALKDRKTTILEVK